MYLSWFMGNYPVPNSKNDWISTFTSGWLKLTWAIMPPPPCLELQFHTLFWIGLTWPIIALFEYLLVLYFFRLWLRIGETSHGPLALDALLVPKISKRHFFQDIKNSFHGVTWMGLEPHQIFFQIFFSTNMVARGVQSFCILEGTTDPLIEQWLKFSSQFSPDIWWTSAENFKSISWAVSELGSFNWKILGIARLR